MALSDTKSKSSDGAMEGKPIRKRKVFIAAILSFCPGLGQQYSGHLYRGILLYISVIVISWIAAIAFMYVKSTYLSIAILSTPIVISLLIMVDAVYCANKQPSDYKIKWYNRPWIYVGVFAFLFVTINPLMDLLIGKHVVRAYLADSQSMYPTILNRDVLLINKLENPQRKDVVLIGFEEDQPAGTVTKIIENDTLRRVIATPGDKIEIRGRKVLLNDAELDEPYVNKGLGVSPNALNHEKYAWGPETVPENEYFVLSDARQYTFDSRVIGFIKKERILGVATKVFWSWNLDGGGIRWDRTAMSIQENDPQ